MAESEVPERSARRLVWDLPTRLFHWALALTLAGSWITAEAGFEYFKYHLWCGYTALTLIAFRLIWGVVGPRHARFAGFLHGPGKVLRSLKSLVSRDASTHAGHSPHAGWATVVLLAAVATQATSGMFISDDIFYAGPYNAVVSSATAGQLAQLHHLNFTWLQILVALHLSTMLWYRLRKGQNLVGAMITGRKTAAEADAIPSSRLWLGAAIFAACAGGMYLLVTLAPPPVSYF